MAETRSVDELVDALVTIQARLDAFELTMGVRVASRPTGDIEPCLRSTPKTGTLVLNGQTVSRVTYPVLWQFAQDEGLVAANLFTVGDGSTTFGLPNFAGRTILGVGTGAGGTYALASIGGSITQLLTTAMMPVHNHGSVANHSHGTGDTNTVGHNHGFTTDSEPNHGAHVSADNVNHAVGTGGPHGHTPVWGANLGGHNHGGTTANTNHTHTVTMDPGGGHTHSDNGGTTPVPILQPYIAVNWLIYV